MRAAALAWALVPVLVTKWSQKPGSKRASTVPTTVSVAGTCRFFTVWGHTQLKVHLKTTGRVGYLLIHRGGRGHRRLRTDV